MEVEIGKGRFFTGDCFDVMRDLPDGSVDMVLCDLPYGTTACAWDSVLPFDELWEHYRRIAKPSAPIVLTAAQPFTSTLVCSNIENFKHRWIWDKVKPSTGLRAKYEPLRNLEDVLVFCSARVPYYPQMVEKARRVEKKNDRNGGAFGDARVERLHDNGGLGYPKELITISNADQSGRLHPTQKPVALFEYLIRTYTDEDMVVLDNTAGSGTTAVAAENAGRRWICIERDEGYAEKAIARIREHVSGSCESRGNTARKTRASLPVPTHNVDQVALF